MDLYFEILAGLVFGGQFVRREILQAPPYPHLYLGKFSSPQATHGADSL